MKSIKIAIKNKTNLTLQLEKKYDISYFEKPTFLSKLLFQKVKYPDIYFHKGIINKESISLIQNAQIVIVDTNIQKHEIMQKLSFLDHQKIKVVSPYNYSKVEYSKSIKQAFKKKHEIAKKSKIIFFRARDLEKGGINYLFDTISRMYQEDFVLLIESNSKQIEPLKLKMERAKLNYKYILLNDYDNLDELFIASDIFLLPTQQKLFAFDILRAMRYKNAVFIMEKNYASELVDTFSLIQDESDKSTSFKIDSLLINKEELKNIQKENKNKTSSFTLDKSIENITTIIAKNFDI